MLEREYPIGVSSYPGTLGKRAGERWHLQGANGPNQLLHHMSNQIRKQIQAEWLNRFLDLIIKKLPLQQIHQLQLPRQLQNHNSDHLMFKL